jgi:hypothetical protein
LFTDRALTASRALLFRFSEEFVGDMDELVSPIRRGLSLHMRAKFDAARTNIERARELLTDAHAVAAAHGYANVERRATQALEGLE